MLEVLRRDDYLTTSSSSTPLFFLFRRCWSNDHDFRNQSDNEGGPKKKREKREIHRMCITKSNIDVSIEWVLGENERGWQ